jgi:hypothetical protein
VGALACVGAGRDVGAGGTPAAVGVPTAPGPSTPTGMPALTTDAGVGSTETHPEPVPRSTSGHAWASAPTTVVVPSGERDPPVNPMATLVGIPRERAIKVNASVKLSQLPVRVLDRNATTGETPGVGGGCVSVV